jgi:hypothetical protein
VGLSERALTAVDAYRRVRILFTRRAVITAMVLSVDAKLQERSEKIRAAQGK